MKAKKILKKFNKYQAKLDSLLSKTGQSSPKTLEDYILRFSLTHSFEITQTHKDILLFVNNFVGVLKPFEHKILPLTDVTIYEVLRSAYLSNYKYINETKINYIIMVSSLVNPDRNKKILDKADKIALDREKIMDNFGKDFISRDQKSIKVEDNGDSNLTNFTKLRELTGTPILSPLTVQMEQLLVDIDNLNKTNKDKSN